VTLPWHLPFVLGAYTLTPAGVSLTLTGGTPSVVVGTVLAPAGASLTLTGGTPAVNVGTTLVPAGASLTLTGGTPTVTATANVVLTPAGGSLTLTGGTPAISSILLTPAGATLTLTAGTPVVSNTLLITPAGGSLTLTGGTPQVIIPRGPINPAPALMGLFPGTPSITIGMFFDSYRVAAISLADYVQPAYTGTGARMYRATSATVNPVLTVAGTPALLPANTFDTIDIATADITVDLVNGGFIVATPGWYRISSRLQSTVNLSSINTAPSAFGLCLYKNGTFVAVGVAGWGILTATFYSGPDSLFGDFDVKLSAGDAVQLGNYVDSTDMQAFHIVGDSGGAETYAMITLMNRAG
jgi:hypothetical protein